MNIPRLKGLPVEPNFTENVTQMAPLTEKARSSDSAPKSYSLKLRWLLSLRNRAMVLAG
jgi:hypothetical protein